jgi:D-xylose reductase
LNDTAPSLEKIPTVGLGMWKIEKPKVADVVHKAIEVGYRHFDCACDYGNEAQVGEGLATAFDAGLCQRDELWVTSKLWNTYHAAEHVQPAIEKTLQDLKLQQLDLYLVHFPIATKYVPFDVRYPPEWFFDPEASSPKMELAQVSIRETWEAMEALVDAGLTKRIGVANFNCQMLRDVLTYARIRPSHLQVELHPLLSQEKLLRFCESQNIEVTGFSPLGAESYFSLGMADQSESLLDNALISSIAKAHDKTTAQVMLRWAVQRGTSIVPKTSNYDRLVENLSIFDFELSADEVSQISSLNQNRRFNDPGDFCESAFNTFCPIYE